MIKTIITSVSPVFLFTLWPLSAAAQTYTIDDFTISGGGGVSSGGNFRITGTVGQSAANSLNGGDYVLHGGFWAPSLEVSLPEPGASFTAWMESLSGENQPPEGQRGPDDEPSGDGMSNLFKYALGLMPMVPSPEAAPKLAIVSKTENGIEEARLSVEFQRSPEAAVVFELEASQDMITWEKAGFTSEVTGTPSDNREQVRLVSNIRIASGGMHFLRLVVDEL